jgi:hypothetical protein
VAKASTIQSSFNGGEFSPLAQGRVEAERYKTGLATCENYLPVIQGPLLRRPGSEFIAEVKDSTKATRLQSFKFSNDDAFILEFSPSAIRFIKNYGQVLETAKNITAITAANPPVVTSVSHGFSNGHEVFIAAVEGMTELNGRNFKVAGVTADTFTLKDLQGNNIDASAYTAYSVNGTASRVYTIASNYQEADLFDLNFNQSADVLYITHPDYPPQKLSRTADTSWTLAVIDILDGPYLPFSNTALVTLTPSATTGVVNLTASSALFASTDAGRLIQIKTTATWSWGSIVSYTSPTVVSFNIRGPAVDASATTQWRLGSWSGTTGYPSCSCFHEDRLVFGRGNTAYPQRFDGSVTGDYENFSPYDFAGTIVDSNAISFNLNSSDVNDINWLDSSERGLLMGTKANEWAVQGADPNAAISPTNLRARQVTSYGSGGVYPVKANKNIIFPSNSKRRLREIGYVYESDGFKAPDRTLIAEHILGADGVKQMAYQKEPQPLVWCVRNDGQLATMTYENSEESLIVGWARQILGGASDLSGTHALVESVAVIPSQDGTQEDVYVVVKRVWNPSTTPYYTRNIEVISRFFTEDALQRDAFCVDSGLTYDNPKTISAIATSTIVITANAHGFSNGDFVWLEGIIGMPSLNDTKWEVANITGNTFTLIALDSTVPSGPQIGTYISGGTARKYVSSITGLWHLPGLTDVLPDTDAITYSYKNAMCIKVLADGGVGVRPVTGFTISQGTLTLAEAAITVQIGIKMRSRGQLLRPEAGAQDGTSIGKTRRVNRVAFDLFRTGGLKIGTSFDDLTEIGFGTTSDALNSPTPLFTGIISQELPSDYDFDNQICWEQDGPLPGTIRGVMPQIFTQDRG